MATHEECLRYLSENFKITNDEIFEVRVVEDNKLLCAITGGRLDDWGVETLWTHSPLFEQGINPTLKQLLTVHTNNMLMEGNFNNAISTMLKQLPITAVEIEVTEVNEDSPETVFEKIEKWAFFNKLQN